MLFLEGLGRILGCSNVEPFFRLADFASGKNGVDIGSITMSSYGDEHDALAV